jgi:hypothetical protein
MTAESPPISTILPYVTVEKPDAVFFAMLPLLQFDDCASRTQTAEREK